MLGQQFDQLYVIRVDAFGTHQFAGVGVDRILLPHELEKQAVAHADSAQLVGRVHQKMCHEVVEGMAADEADEAHLLLSEHEVLDVELPFGEFTFVEALVTEPCSAVRALDMLSRVALNSAEHELDPLVQVLPVVCEKSFE